MLSEQARLGRFSMILSYSELSMWREFSVQTEPGRPALRKRVMIAKQLLVCSLFSAIPAALHSASRSDWPGYLGPARDARALSPGGELAGAR